MMPSVDQLSNILLQTLQMTLMFLARGSEQINEIPRGAALEL